MRRPLTVAVASMSILSCASLSCGAEVSADDRAWVRPVLVYGSCNAADYWSTRQVISAGGREVVLPAQSSGGHLAFKVAATALETWGDVKLQRSGHKGWARAARVAAVVVSGFAVVHNLREKGKLEQKH